MLAVRRFTSHFGSISVIAAAIAIASIAGDAQAQCEGWSVEQVGTDVDATLLARCDWSSLLADALSHQAAIEKEKLPTRGAGKRVNPSRLGSEPFEKRVEDTVRKSVRPAALAVNWPDMVEPGKTATIMAVVLTAQEQHSDPLLAVNSGGQITNHTISITGDVQLALLGADLEIQPDESAWRTLTRMAPAAWNWRITAPNEGARVLTLVMRGRIKIGDDEKFVDLSHHTRTINFVETTQGRLTRQLSAVQTVVEGIQGMWLAAVGVCGLFFGWGMRLFRRKNRTSALPSNDGGSQS